MDIKEATARAFLDQIETQAQQLAHLVDRLEANARTHGDVDGRSIATARTQLQGGFKWLRDAVNKPSGF